LAKADTGDRLRIDGLPAFYSAFGKLKR